MLADLVSGENPLLGVQPSRCELIHPFLGVSTWRESSCPPSSSSSHYGGSTIMTLCKPNYISNNSHPHTLVSVDKASTYGGGVVKIAHNTDSVQWLPSNPLFAASCKKASFFESYVIWFTILSLFYSSLSALSSVFHSLPSLQILLAVSKVSFALSSCHHLFHTYTNYPSKVLSPKCLDIINNIHPHQLQPTLLWPHSKSCPHTALSPLKMQVPLSQCSFPSFSPVSPSEA